jgi:hypothetical protein
MSANVNILDPAPSPDQVDAASAIFLAGEHAYSELVERGYPEDEIHKIALCYDASAIMVGKLTEWGYSARHEVYVSPSLGEHSIASVSDHTGETIGDATWQQFLADRSGDTSHMPKMLVGNRESVAAQAAAYAVNPDALDFWRGVLQRRDPKQQRQINAEAARAADTAADQGLWEAFMASATVDKEKPQPRHRRATVLSRVLARTTFWR